MPILEYHLVEGQHSDAQCQQLLEASSVLYAEVLRSPIERVRVFVHLHRAQMVAVGGRLVSQGAASAPYFHFLVLQGRPGEERQRLLTGFTDLVERILGVQRNLIRGGCWPIAPEDWAIGGTPASEMRKAEIAARAAATAQD